MTFLDFLTLFALSFPVAAVEYWLGRHLARYGDSEDE